MNHSSPRLAFSKQPLDSTREPAHSVLVNLNATISPCRSVPGKRNLLNRTVSLLCVAAMFVFSISAALSAINPALDWPAWRGPTGDGLAASGQNPPVQWSETEGIVWKTPIPGRGHGSPTVV